jgi:type I restriction enzyme, S subunit
MVMEAIRPGYKKTEIGIIPEDWNVQKIQDFANVFRGGSPRPIEAYLTRNPNGVNWIKIGDVHKSAKFIESTKEKIISEGVSRSRFVKKGDFLLSNSMSFGRPYILNVDGCIHDGWLVIQNYDKKFDKHFLYYLLGSEVVFHQYKTLAAGSGVLNLKKEIVNEVMVITPSKSEQEAIATVLSETDELIESLNKLIAKKKDVKQGTMQLLLTGKKRLEGFEGEWECLKLIDLCKKNGLIRGPFGGSLKKDFFVSSGIKVYEQKNAIYKNSSLGKYFINYEKFLELQRFEVFPKDFIVSCSGTIGSIYQLPSYIQKGIINQALLIIRTDSAKIHDKYFLYYFMWDEFQEEIIDNTQGGAMKNLVGMDVFKNTTISVPKTIEEQKAIADVLSSMDEETETLEKERDKYVMIKKGMMQQLLTGSIRIK